MPTTSRVLSYVTWLLVSGAVAWFAYSQYQDYLAKQNRRSIEQRQIKEQVVSLLALSSAHGARPNWPSELVGKEKVRMAPLVSLELQEVWQLGSPITFVGILRDIARNKDGSYQVLLQHDQFSTPHQFLSTKLFFSARCSPEIAAPLLVLIRDTDRMPVIADTAIVGNVLEVISAQASSESGDETRITGTGTCLAAMTLAKFLPEDWAAGK